MALVTVVEGDCVEVANAEGGFDGRGLAVAALDDEGEDGEARHDGSEGLDGG